MNKGIKLIECPRDAMQGIPFFIETEQKVKYINKLLQVGFDTIDFGSFVSPKAIPQMKDTAEVLGQLELDKTRSKLLAIIGNVRGANDASQFKAISYLGFPFSISETFQKRNLNSTINNSYDELKAIQEICLKHNKELVTYLSMGFGNPYGDAWNLEIVEEWVEKIAKLNIKIISLSDTVGTAKPQDIATIFNNVTAKFQSIEFGAHLHARPDNWLVNLEAAYKNGCRRFDGAIKGYGGCPMAKDELVGNMPTENMVQYFQNQKETTNINNNVFTDALRLAVDTLA